jgi:hypothetical protein
MHTHTYNMHPTLLVSCMGHMIRVNMVHTSHMIRVNMMHTSHMIRVNMMHTSHMIRVKAT